MITLHFKYLFVALSPEQRKRDEIALQLFPGIVNNLVPELTCDVEPFDSRLAELYFEALDKAQTASDIGSIFYSSILRESEFPIPRIVVFCTRESRIASLMIENNPAAEWGATSGLYAAIYRHDRFLVWHEMFHLLGAEDCYDTAAPDIAEIPTCGNIGCVMQYAPTEATVSDPPFLCESNRKRIVARHLQG